MSMPSRELKGSIWVKVMAGIFAAILLTTLIYTAYSIYVFRQDAEKSLRLSGERLGQTKLLFFCGTFVPPCPF